jgi:hypothetical protein
LAPGDLFSTPEQAAYDALSFINGRSIQENIEYGEKIRVSSSGRFYAETPASLGRGDSFSLELNKTADANTVGDYHTHGDYSRYDIQGNLVRTSPRGDTLGSDDFSLSDKTGTYDVAAFLNKPTYVAYLGNRHIQTV